MRRRLPVSGWGRRLRALLTPKYLIFPLIFLVIATVGGTNLVRLTQIECQHSNGDCQPRHLEILENYRGRLILFLKPQQIEAELNQDPSLRSAQVEVSFPHTLRARLESETRLLDVGYILVDDSLSEAPVSSQSANPLWRELKAIELPVTNWYQLNGQGQLLPGTESERRLLILGQSPPTQEKLARLYQLFFLSERNGIGIRKLWLSGQHIGLTSTIGATAFLPSQSDPAAILATLQQILSATTIDFTTTVIDLRFSNPVIVKRVETN